MSKTIKSNSNNGGIAVATPYPATLTVSDDDVSPLLSADYDGRSYITQVQHPFECEDSEWEEFVKSHNLIEVE